MYVLRDLIEGETKIQTKQSYKTIKDAKYEDMDIFRIERLWKNEQLVTFFCFCDLYILKV